MSSVPKYPLEDELLSARSIGLQREIEADLKTLDELNFDSFLEEADPLVHDEENTLDKQFEAEEHEDINENVDEDNFFLENEEDSRIKTPLHSGPLLQKCFKTVLGIEVMQSRIQPPSRKASSFEVSLFSSDSEDSDDLSVDKIFEGIISDDLDTSDSHNKASMAGTSQGKRKIPTLSCPFVTIGCTFQNDQPGVIARHIKKMHKQLTVPKECCGSEFETQMDYHYHIKNNH